MDSICREQAPDDLQVTVATRACLELLSMQPSLRKLYIIGYKPSDTDVWRLYSMGIRGLLDGIAFPGLQEFCSKNIPHAVLVTFLRNHTHIQHLAVGPCLTDGACPIGEICYSCLSSLECPMACAASISSAIVISRFSSNTGSTSESIGPALCKTLLNYQPWIGNLHQLELQLSFVSLDLIQKVYQFAPQLAKLSLVESPTGYTARLSFSKRNILLTRSVG